MLMWLDESECDDCNYSTRFQIQVDMALYQSYSERGYPVTKRVRVTILVAWSLLSPLATFCSLPLPNTPAFVVALTPL